MAQIHNTDLTKELKDGAKIQQLKDVIPTQLAEKVVPVMEVNPKLLRRINIIRSLSGAGTIYTTPADKDFYLCWAQMSCISFEQAGVLKTDTITATLDGGTASVILRQVLTSGGAASNSAVFGNTTYNPALPVKLARNTAITSSMQASAGGFDIAGFVIDNPNA